MSEEALESDADYGHLPFDLFLSERWDNTDDSEEQWERLVWEWQSLTLLERWPYQKRAQSEISPPTVSEEIKRVLSTYQTTHERNTSVLVGHGRQTIWLRTCYDAALASKYEELKHESNIPWSIPESRVLDDAARYDFDDGSADSWRQVLVRVPGLTDLDGIIDQNGDETDLQYKSGQDDEFMTAQAQEGEQWREVCLAELRIQSGIFLLDREAITSGVIKLLWLDEHGHAVWDNRIEPHSIDGLLGALLMATRLEELTGSDGGSRGAMIWR